MPDYKKLYLRLFSATTEIIEILVKAQLEAEELFIDEKDPDFKILKLEMNQENTGSDE